MPISVNKNKMNKILIVILAIILISSSAMKLRTTYTLDDLKGVDPEKECPRCQKMSPKDSWCTFVLQNCYDDGTK